MLMFKKCLTDFKIGTESFLVNFFVNRNEGATHTFFYRMDFRIYVNGSVRGAGDVVVRGVCVLRYELLKRQASAIFIDTRCGL